MLVASVAWYGRGDGGGTVEVDSFVVEEGMLLGAMSTDPFGEAGVCDGTTLDADGVALLSFEAGALGSVLGAGPAILSVAGFASDPVEESELSGWAKAEDDEELGSF